MEAPFRRPSQDSLLHETSMHLVDELRRYMNFAEADAARMVELGQHVAGEFEGVVGAFYDALEANTRTAAAFEDQAQLDRLRHSLHRWLEELFCGVYDLKYYHKRLHIGRVHMNVGIAPHFVSGAIAIVREQLEQLIRAKEPAPGVFASHLMSMHKVLDLELCLMHQSYWDRLIEEKLRLPQALASGMAHEIRNPLNGMALNLTLLERRVRHLDVGKELGPMVEVMREEIRRIGELTTQVMDFAKPVELQLGWIDVPHMLQAIETMHAQTLAAAGITLVTRWSGEPQMWGDRDRLIQVLTNLVVNAAEAIEHEGRVEVEVEHYQTHVHLRVRDDGKGMNPADKFRVFDLFFTQKIQGTGLGLAIVKKIVEAHRGTIDLSTRAGAGTEFALLLPAEPGS